MKNSFFLIVLLFTSFGLLGQYIDNKVSVAFDVCGEMEINFEVEQGNGGLACFDVDRLGYMMATYPSGGNDVPFLYFYDKNQDVFKYINALGQFLNAYPNGFQIVEADPSGHCGEYTILMPFGASFTFPSGRGGDASFKWKGLPGNIDNQILDIQLTGHWDYYGAGGENFGPDQLNGRFSTNIPNSGANSSYSTLNATSDNCDNVTLTWSAITGLPSCNNRSIEIQKAVQGTDNWEPSTPISRSISTTSYADINAQKGVPTKYRIRHKFAPSSDRVIYSNWTETASTSPGLRLGKLQPPTSITASKGGCQKYIEVGWSWTNSDTYLGGWKIERRVKNPAGNWETIADDLLPGDRSYQDVIDDDSPVIPNVEYEYRVSSINTCVPGDISDPSPAPYAFGVGPGAPNAPQISNVSTIAGANKKITIEWDYTATPVDDGFIVIRQGGPSPLTRTINDITARSFEDVEVQECTRYTYVVKAKSECFDGDDAIGTSSISATISPDLSTTFAPGSLSASKGIYPDRVQLEWVNNNSALISDIRIYRKILGSSAAFTNIATLPSNSSIYNDFTGDAGTLFEYRIEAIADCDGNNVLSNTVSAVGFRLKSGQVSGKVTYQGQSSIAVSDVKIKAESTTGEKGGGLHMNGGALVVPMTGNQSISNAAILESWMKPEAYAADFTVYDQGCFSLKYVHNTGVYQASAHDGGTTYSIEISKDSLPIGQWNHLAAQVANDSLFIYVNGDIAKKRAMATGFMFDCAGSTGIRIFDGYRGGITEVRAWSRAKSLKEVFRDHGRALVGTENNLFLFLPMTEGAGDFAYDRSRINQNTFNLNHAKINGSHSWIIAADGLPTVDQLSFAGYTDENGDYVITLPYGSAGSNYRLTPIYQTHRFSPSSKLLFVGDGASVINGEDFIDESSFRVTGFVNYKNTVCPVEEAFVKVDGEILRNIDGKPVFTDSKGEFDILVPIGDHVISVEKANHVFSQGRFPPTGTYSFQKPETGVEFIDSTTVKVIGRVVGGLREASKSPGFGKSKNNIGQAVVMFESRNGCLIETATTVDTSGEYEIDLPPLKYTGSASIASNLGITFDRPLLDYDDTPIPRIVRDTTINPDASETIDSIVYNYQLDFIHRAKPIVVVTDKDGVSDFIGDTSLVYQPPMGPAIERDLRTNPLPWPVFTPNDGTVIGKKYKAMVKVYEPYTNFDNASALLRDSVPTTDGIVRVTNRIADSLSHPIKMSDINTLDTLKSLVIEFDVGDPNFSENNIAKYSYTKRFEIAYIPNSGPTIFWEPGYLSSIDPADSDKAFRGYVLGRRTLGTRYFTEGPQRPEFVLRDPPGSNSSASRNVGSTTSYNRSWSWNLGQEASTTDKLAAGVDFTAGFGISLQTTIKNDINLGFSAELSGGRNGSINESVSTSQTYSTSSTTDLVGSGSDVYIGKSQNIEFGATEDLSLVPISECANIQCLGPDYNGFRFARTAGIALAPEGYNTYFAYSQGYIVNYLMPLLKVARDGLLQGNPSRYRSHLPIDHELYGVNNDDERLNNPVDCGNQTPCFATLSGPSYTFYAATEQDSLTGDSVRYINQQIQMWEEAIALNEWEKAVIGDIGVIDSLYNEEHQKLLDEYAGAIAAQAVTGAVSIGALGAITYGIIVAPVPGTATAGTITFGITTAAGIANAETASRFEEFLLKEKRLDQKFEAIRGAANSPTNRSISSGNSYSEEMSTSTAISSGGSIEYTIAAEQKFDIVAKVNGTGFAFEKGFKTSFDYSRDWGQEENSSESVSFTISDDDQPDFFSVDIYPSMLGWGPIFKKKDGGQTSCPYEDEEYSLFYRDTMTNQPVRLSGKTLQIDKPRIEASPTVPITNVPANSAASFELTLFNDSEAAAAREYRIQTVSSSNPYGAIIRYDGSPGGATVAIPGDNSVTKTITINKGPGARLVYDSILIVMYAPCQYEAGTSDNLDIVDSAYVSVHFLPECTDVSILNPTDQWILNNSYKDTMTMVIGDYDINYSEFQEIKLQFKSTESPLWNDLQSFYVNSDGIPDPDSIVIPRDAPQIQWDWPVNDEVDGSYDLRAISVCKEASKISSIHRGYMDRINPHAFGSPSPADGILDPNDDILLSMNEPIDLGSVLARNFSVSGLLNGTTLANENSLSFDGANDYGTIPEYQLQQRSFTIEFWMRREGHSGTREYILSQGQSASDQLAISVEPDGRLRMQVGDREIFSESAITDTDWYHTAFVYDRDANTASIYLAHDTRDFRLPDANEPSFFTDYQGDGLISVARNSTNGSDYYAGALRDLRLWAVPRTEGLISEFLSRSLSGREPGLIGAWLMNESYGTVAIDKVRSRDMQVSGASWMILPQNHSVVFNGIDDYLVAENAADLSFGEESDLTIEAWFKTGSSTKQTILSNGLSDGSLPINSFWSLSIDPTGALVIENDGNSIKSPSGYNDDNWHHISIVIDRTFAVSMYMDGKLVRTDNATTFKSFVGPKLWIGCRGWIQSQPLMEHRDQFWEGSLDDIRLWNVARRPEQVSRDYVYQQKGDEIGLIAYYPFDGIETINNIRSRIPDLLDATDNDYHLRIGNDQVDTFSINAPSIKLPRLVQNVNFTYSINNDQIFIEIDEPPSRIENVTIDIVVDDLKDIAGNVMAEAETWIAYIDKNQVFWETEYFNFEKDIDESLSFTATIKNTGGSQEQFVITNIPSWLSASTSGGLLEPNSSIEVTFSVLPGINIGEYEQDIYVSTESFGFNERLLLDLKVTAEPPIWDFDPTPYDYSMNIIGELKVNDVISTDVEDMVSVWIGDELHGMAHVQFDPVSGKHLLFLTIANDVSLQEPLEFRAWDASTGRILVGLQPDNLVFNDNTLMGTLGQPLSISAEVLTKLTYHMKTGWNWISFPLMHSVLSDVNGTLNELSPTVNDEIRTSGRFNGVVQGLFDTYKSTLQWSGSLGAVGFDTEKGYKIFLSEADTFSYEGTLIDPASEPIDIEARWNWIGVKSEVNLPTNTALSSLNPSQGDLIKGQQQFAIYDTTFKRWSGNLSFLSPQQGYMLKSATAQQLIYPGAGGVTPVISPVKEYQYHMKSQKEEYILKSISSADLSGYSANMSLTAAISECLLTELSGEEIDLSEWILVAHIGEEIRGLTSPIWEDGLEDYLFYLSIAGEQPAELSFRLIKADGSDELSLGQVLTFGADIIEGTPSEPYSFTCGARIDCIDDRMYRSRDINAELSEIVQKARYSIGSDAIIPKGISIQFRAGDRIELLEGFETNKGASLEILIEECNEKND